MLSQKGPTPLWDFPPSDLKMSKSPILDFRFDNNNQEMLQMFSTIARSFSAPKLLKPKKKKLLTPGSDTKPVSKLPSHLFVLFFGQLESLVSLC